MVSAFLYFDLTFSFFPTNVKYLSIDKLDHIFLKQIMDFPPMTWHQILFNDYSSLARALLNAGVPLALEIPL